MTPRTQRLFSHSTFFHPGPDMPPSATPLGYQIIGPGTMQEKACHQMTPERNWSVVFFSGMGLLLASLGLETLGRQEKGESLWVVSSLAGWREWFLQRNSETQILAAILQHIKLQNLTPRWKKGSVRPIFLNFAKYVRMGWRSFNLTRNIIVELLLNPRFYTEV